MSVTELPERVKGSNDRRSKDWWHGAPICTALLLTASLVASASPAWCTAWEYDRAGIADGQLWRLVTGHFVHWGGDHLFWDGVVFAALGVMCERMGRAFFLCVTGGTALAISAAIWLLDPAMATYRGLSGIDTALFTAVALSILAEKVALAEWRWVAGGAVMLAGLLAKSGYEHVTGSTLIVDSGAAGFTPAPLAHLVGAAVGAAAVLPMIWRIYQGNHQQAAFQ